MQIWIVWLPNVWKSTLFNAITKSSNAQAANYPFCTIDPNVWIVEVPDERLRKLTEVVVPKKTIPTIVEFVDIAWLVAWASQWEWLWNKFLSHIRSCHAIAQVVRFFEDWDVLHVSNKVEPKVDKETIETELIIADTQTLEKAIEKAQKDTKAWDKKMLDKYELLKNILTHLEQGKLANAFEINDEDEQLIMRDLHLLTNKPILYIANVSEEKIQNFDIDKTKELLGLWEKDFIIPVCAQLESDLAEMTDEEGVEFLNEYWINSSGREHLIRSAYKTLNLETYFTAWVQEVRAWTIKKWSTAPKAAWVIHTDFEKWFICADIVHWKDLVDHWWETKAKELWLIKMQWKEYIVQDWDVCHFKFNN